MQSNADSTEKLMYHIFLTTAGHIEALRMLTADRKTKPLASVARDVWSSRTKKFGQFPLQGALSPDTTFVNHLAVS